MKINEQQHIYCKRTPYTPREISDQEQAFWCTRMMLRCQQKTNFFTQFFACYFLKAHLHFFSKIKSKKESQNSRIQGFSYYFCMMTEGSGSRTGSGSIPLTSGSGSGGLINTWIRIRIRIRNAAAKSAKFLTSAQR
jgi:hypothetical protein